MTVPFTTIRPKRAVTPKVKMTEEEFRAKLAYSSAQAKAGHYIEKKPEETVEQFIDRLLCQYAPDSTCSF